MSLHRIYGENLIAQFAWECNGCGENLDTGTEDFAEARGALTARGWRIAKDEDDEWAHYCPTCRAAVRPAADFKRWMD